MNILLLDDNQQTREAISDFIRSENYLCQCAESYDQAEGFLRAAIYDLLLIDYRLEDRKERTGADLIRNYRLKKPCARCAYITAFKDEIPKEDMIVDKTFDKPVKFNKLMEYIRSVERDADMNTVKNCEEHAARLQSLDAGQASIGEKIVVIDQKVDGIEKNVSRLTEYLMGGTPENPRGAITDMQIENLERDEKIKDLEGWKKEQKEKKSESKKAKIAFYVMIIGSILAFLGNLILAAK